VQGGLYKKKVMVNLEKLNEISTQSNMWMKDAKRKKKWRWLTKYTVRIHVKYLTFKRLIKSKL
jgi:hypothetical protein